MGPSAPAWAPSSLTVFPRAAKKAIPIGLVVSSLVLYVAVLAGSGHQDFDTYLGAGRDLLAGRPLYAAFLHHPFPDATLRPAYIYPPVFAVLVAPLSWLPPVVAVWTWLLLMQAALALAIVGMLRHLRPEREWPARWVGLCLTLTFFPLLVDVAQGQVNLLVLVLVVLGIIGILRGRAASGLLVGAAAAIKLTPLLLIGWLIAQRRWRAAGFVGLGFGSVTGVGALVRPDDTATFFRQVLPALAHGTAYYSNQSLFGVLGRVLTTNPYTAPWLSVAGERWLAGVGGLVVLAVWVVNARRLDPTSAAVSFLPLLPLLSAVTWEHHVVVVLPLIWLIVDRLAARGWPVPETGLLGIIIGGCSLLPRLHWGPSFGSPGFRAAQTSDPLVFLSANALFVGALLLLVASPRLLRRAASDPVLMERVA
jgi:alpha-1,2-mannosyltransferase